MASNHGGYSKVSAMVNSDDAQVSAIVAGNDAKGLAMVKHDDGIVALPILANNNGYGDGYDSSNSPNGVSSVGDDDVSNYGEEEEKMKKSLAMVVSDVIEDVSPLAKGDVSASSTFLANGMFSNAPFGIIGDNSHVTILKRNHSATVRSSSSSSSSSFSMVNNGGKMEVMDGGEGCNVRGNRGSSLVLSKLEEGKSFEFPNYINGDVNLPNQHLSGDKDFPNSNSNFERENNNLPYSISLNKGDGADLAFAFNNQSDFGKNDLIAEINLASSKANVALNRQDLNGLIESNPNLRADLILPNVAPSNIGNRSDVINVGRVNGQFINGKSDLSPNVVEVNMESFKCDFPPLNGQIKHDFNVGDCTSKGRANPNLNSKFADVACGGVADVACGRAADVACHVATDVDKSKNYRNSIGVSSYANALGVSSGNEFRTPSKSVSLQFIKPSVVDGRVKVCPPVDVAEEGCEVWRTTLVGYFIGRRLPFKVVESIAHKIWGRYGLREVMSSDNGFFFFKFANFQDACVVMERGPWHMANRPLVLKHWQPSMPLAKEDVNKVPVWVRLYNVPFEYWTSRGLSFVASAVGCPLHADHITLSRTRLSYARVCVEIDARDNLVDEFDFQCSNGRWINVRTEFEWVPMRCSACGVFGHTLSTCPRNVSKEESKPSTKWVPKFKAPPTKPCSQLESAEWVTVSRKNKGKGVLKDNALVPFEELVSEVQGPIGASGNCLSEGMEIVVCGAKEEGECSPVVRVPPSEVPVVSCADLCNGDASEPKGYNSISDVDEVTKLSKDAVEPGESDASPIPIVSSLALKARDSLEKKLGKVGKAKMASGGNKGRKSRSPRGGRRS